jgi:exosortase/archaeosortase
MPMRNAGASELVPLTERVLARLPGPRVIWIIAWAVLPLVVDSTVRSIIGAQIFTTETLLAGAVAACGNLVALWGVAKLRRDVEAVNPVVTDLTGGRLDAGQLFRAMGAIRFPLLFMAGFATLYGLGEIRRVGAAIVPITALGFVAWLPVVTLAWVAGVILLGLHRLGGMPLKLKPFEEDRSLGLRKLGSLAFTPLLLYAAGAIPAMIIRGPTRIEDVVVNISILLVIVVLLFASLTRLRRQLIAAKADHLAWARDLYVHALAPVRSGGSRESLGAQAAVIQAAESLERRAAVIQEWPFDEGILRSIVAIVTSVITALVVRLILSRLGL